MRIYSGVYRLAGPLWKKRQSALSLQHVLLGRGECLLAVVSEGENPSLADRIVRELTDWFYHEGKELICRNTAKELILLALQRQFYLIQEILRKTEKLNCCGILLVRNRYYLFRTGSGNVFAIRGSKVSCLMEQQEGSSFFGTGKIRRRSGFLVCTGSFGNGQQDKRWQQGLTTLLRRDGVPLERRLELLGEHSGGEDCMAAAAIIRGGAGWK